MQVYDDGHRDAVLFGVIGDGGRDQSFAGLLEKDCHLRIQRGPRCLVRPVEDSPFALAVYIIFRMRPCFFRK